MLEPQTFLVCPRSKQPLQQDGQVYVAPCGFRYPDGDFRVGLDYGDDWATTQREYEIWLEQWRRDNEEGVIRMEAVDATFEDVYDAIKLEGKVLDVAGDIGTVVTQAGIDGSQYVSLDTMKVDFAAIERRFPKYAQYYSKSRDSCFLQGSAEFLPVADLTFDTVHVRGCLDHFTAPHIALMEAYRVLQFGGLLVVGLALEGAYQKDTTGWEPAPTEEARLRSLYKAGVQKAKRYPAVFNMAFQVKTKLMGEHDHHIFHPTYESLCKLIRDAGFEIEHEVWQKAFHNVLYVSARKPLRGSR